MDENEIEIMFRKAGGKDADKPNLDVPKLEVPTITEFTSEGGNKYVRERPIEEIAEDLMKPQEEEQETTLQKMKKGLKL